MRDSLEEDTLDTPAWYNSKAWIIRLVIVVVVISAIFATLASPKVGTKHLWKSSDSLSQREAKIGEEENEVKLNGLKVSEDVIPKKIYVMAHRCNTKGSFDYAVTHNANGIEVDILKRSSDGRVLTRHDPVDPKYEYLSDWLDHVAANIGVVSLIIFDLKYSSSGEIKAADINNIRGEVKNRLLNKVNGLYVLYGLTEAAAGEMEQAISGSPLEFREGINYDAVLNTTPQVALAWKFRHNVANFMYSAGICAACSSNKMWARLREARDLRTSAPFGTYSWTYGKASSASRDVKEYNLDGVLGNFDSNYGSLPNYLSSYGLGEYSLVARNEGPPFTMVKGSTLHAGGRLAKENFLPSLNNNYFVVMQQNCDLVLYRGIRFGSAQILWTSNTAHAGQNCFVEMQHDSNFVVYGTVNGHVRPLWASQTSQYSGAYVAMQDDGNLVVYAFNVNGALSWSPVWATNTANQLRELKKQSVASDSDVYYIKEPKQDLSFMPDYVPQDVIERS